MEELKRLFNTLHSFHKTLLLHLVLWVSPLSVLTVFFQGLCHKHQRSVAQQPVSDMDKKVCPVGEKYDLLVKRCVDGSSTKGRPTPAERLTEPPLPPVVQVKSTYPAPQTSSMIFLSPALWICVGLVTLGSILIVSLWIMIYRKHNGTSRTPDDSEKQREPVLLPSQPAETNRHAAASPCSAHLHPGARTRWEWEEDFTTCRCPPMHAGMRGERGLEHRVPLPATELGGTVLVTTKTV